jgi:hypothetical protein
LRDSRIRIGEMAYPFVHHPDRVYAALLRRSHWHLQYLRNSLQATCADAVRSIFIFLQLLERQTERIGDIRLGHIKHQAAHAHAFSDMFVGRVYSILLASCSRPAGTSAKRLHHPAVCLEGGTVLVISLGGTRDISLGADATAVRPRLAGLDLDHGARRGRMMAGRASNLQRDGIHPSPVAYPYSGDTGFS